jgi:LacI family transcriptional regulator, galactose operon repressor
MRQRTTLQNIADSLGITKVTVSRALKGQAGVSEELRTEIEKKAEEMNYKRSSLHNSQEVLDFRFIVPKRYFLKTSHFYTDIYFTLHQLCDQKKYRISLQIIDPDMEDGLELPNNIHDSQLSGLFIGGELSKNYLRLISNLNLPTIVIDHFSPFVNFTHLTVDNYYLGYKAATYLIEKGHKDIGIIGQNNISSNVTDRIMGIRKALIENDLTLPEEWIVSNYNQKTQLNTIDFELPVKLPTAFICQSDLSAFYFMEKLKSKELSVPEDISVLSFDDTEIAQEMSPMLTSIKIDRKMFAEKGLEFMEKKIQFGFIKEERIYLSSDLIERESVKRI